MVASQTQMSAAIPPKLDTALASFSEESQNEVSNLEP